MDVSIIIPCYNSGKYLPDALKSVNQAINGNYKCEVILVDDGSTEPASKELLLQLAKQGYIVLTQPNAGPAAARNTGIRSAQGKYLLFLDSDNTIRSHFINTSIDVLETTAADLVHGRPGFFGDSTDPRFYTGEFNINKIITCNYIDTCCMIKRDVCTRIGGFDESKCIIGFEDWEFYIRAYANGCKFHFIDDLIYDYRIVSDSLSQGHSMEYQYGAYAYVYTKHIQFVRASLYWYNYQHQAYLFDRQRPFRSCIKYLYYKVLDKIKRQPHLQNQ